MELKKSLKKIFHAPHPVGKPNPYAKPSNPYSNSPQVPPPVTPGQVFSTPKRPASSRGSSDFLAEARAAVGRDPVTGKRTTSTLPNGHRRNASRSLPNLGSSAEREGRSGGNENCNEGMSAGGVRSGPRYELFVQEMKERREGNFPVPPQGYYAPAPRPMVEYFADEAAVGMGQRGVGGGQMRLPAGKVKKKWYSGVV
ncbi:hypothetical protein BCR34DRAFT_602666 [Clohesyomyces aquaticus]|uniref:Uncharacterized protein n=1 Tax=Clohesyomyces aquaticus TaxID=1231657 RepID=A0A1Y1ZIK5_9PLEO|nr:hypothetical protein BCR34DRAFT_602666 [Clohesyomyces aquaticus]